MVGLNFDLRGWLFYEVGDLIDKSGGAPAGMVDLDVGFW